MGKVPSYPRRELRHLRRQWLMRNKRPVLVVATIFVVCVVVSTWFAVAMSSGAFWYGIGIFQSVAAATFLHAINSAILANEPRAVFQMRGAWGEENTRSELVAAKRRRLVWGWVDSITFRAGDLDHVVVTRQGGVVVLDSKFRTDVTRASVSEMTASAARARTRAEALARTVLPSDRSGRRRTTTTSVTVTPCIVLWGPAARDVPDAHVVDGVHFVAGHKLKEWLKHLPTSPVSRDAATDLLDKLADFRTSANSARR